MDRVSDIDFMQCTTEELNKLLNEILKEENYRDHEVTVKTILKIIMEREKDIHKIITPDIQEMFQRYLYQVEQDMKDTGSIM